jgi:hypothetical protein
MDVVSLAAHPSCVTSRSVTALNAHFNIRNIHVISTTAAKCSIFLSYARNVECHVEDEVLPGVTLQAVLARLAARMPDEGSRQTGRERAGWYFQQLLKLGSATALPGLTEYFMIWDLDMMPLRSFDLFFEPAQSGQQTRTRVDVSTIRFHEYAASYEQLFRQPVEYPAGGQSYVAHWMMVYKPYMLEMLRSVSGTTEPGTWPWKVLDSVQPGYRNVYYGLSEYTMYISWVLQNKPGSLEVMPRKDWNRVAPQKHQWLMDLGYKRCCPDDEIVALARKEGWAYLGWELGGAHASAECKQELEVH